MKYTELLQGKQYSATSPKGDEILGTSEVVPALAKISHFYVGSSSGGGWRVAPLQVIHEHAGGSEVFWDCMDTQTNSENRVIYLCADGEEWTIDQLEFEEIA